MSQSSLIKSKDRVRDHGEVFTPAHIVSDMLDLVAHETHRIDSRFLEPACGDGNFLASILERKLSSIGKSYQKYQTDYEKYLLTAVGSIYGIDLLIDNIRIAQERLATIAITHYQSLFPKKYDHHIITIIHRILSLNIIQGDALSLTTTDGQSLIFSERNFVTGYRIQRTDYIFQELIQPHQSDGLFDSSPLLSENNTPIFLPKACKKYSPCHYRTLFSSSHAHHAV